MQTLSELINPVTRTVVRFEPPFRYATREQYLVFQRLFQERCERFWEGEHRLDPPVMNPNDVMALMIPGVPDVAGVRALDRRLHALVAEFGVDLVTRRLAVITDVIPWLRDERSDE